MHKSNLITSMREQTGASSQADITTYKHQVLEKYYLQIFNRCFNDSEIETFFSREKLTIFFSMLSHEKFEDSGLTVLEYAITNQCLFRLAQLLDRDANRYDISHQYSELFFTRSLFSVRGISLSLLEIFLLFSNANEIELLFAMMSSQEINIFDVSDLEYIEVSRDLLFNIGNNYKQVIECARNHNTLAQHYFEALLRSKEILMVFVRARRLVNQFTLADFQRFSIDFLSAYTRELYLLRYHDGCITPALIQTLAIHRPKGSKGQIRFCKLLKSHLEKILATTKFNVIIRPEYQFACWFADIAIFLQHRDIPEHIIKCFVVEYDGKGHSGKHDEQRDHILHTIFKWSVKRFDSSKRMKGLKEFFAKISDDILAIIDEHQISPNILHSAFEEISPLLNEAQTEQDEEETIATIPALIDSLKLDSDFSYNRWKILHSLIEQQPPEAITYQELQDCLTLLRNYPDCKDQDFGWIIDYDRDRLIDFFMTKLLERINQQTDFNITRKEFNDKFSNILRSEPLFAQLKKPAKPLARDSRIDIIIDFFANVLQTYLYQQESLNSQARSYAKLVYSLFDEANQGLLESVTQTTFTEQERIQTLYTCIHDNFDQLEKLYNESPIQYAYFFNEHPTNILLTMLETLGLPLSEDQIQVRQDGVLITWDAVICTISFHSEIAEKVQIYVSRIQKTVLPELINEEESTIISFTEEAIAFLQEALLKKQLSSSLTQEVLIEIYSHLTKQIYELQEKQERIKNDLHALIQLRGANKNTKAGEKKPIQGGIKKNIENLEKLKLELDREIKYKNSLLDSLVNPIKKDESELSNILDLIIEKLPIAHTSQSQELKLQKTGHQESIILNSQEAAQACTKLSFNAIVKLFIEGSYTNIKKGRYRNPVIQLDILLSQTESSQILKKICRQYSLQFSSKEFHDFILQARTNRIIYSNIFEYFPLQNEHLIKFCMRDHQIFSSFFKQLSFNEKMTIVNHLYESWYTVENTPTSETWLDFVTIICHDQEDLLLPLATLLTRKIDDISGWILLACNEKGKEKYQLLLQKLIERKEIAIIEHLIKLFIELAYNTESKVKPNDILEALYLLFQEFKNIESLSDDAIYILKDFIKWIFDDFASNSELLLDYTYKLSSSILTHTSPINLILLNAIIENLNTIKTKTDNKVAFTNIRISNWMILVECSFEIFSLLVNMAYEKNLDNLIMSLTLALDTNIIVGSNYTAWLYLIAINPRAIELLIEKALMDKQSTLFSAFIHSLSKGSNNFNQSLVTLLEKNLPSTFKILSDDNVVRDVLAQQFIQFFKNHPSSDNYLSILDFIQKYSDKVYYLLFEIAFEPEHQELGHLITQNLKAPNSTASPYLQCRTYYPVYTSFNMFLKETLPDLFAIAVRLEQQALLHAIVEAIAKSSAWPILLTTSGTKSDTFYQELIHELISEICEPDQEALFQLIINGLNQRDEDYHSGWLAFVRHLPSELLEAIETSASQREDKTLLPKIQKSFAKTKETLALFNAFHDSITNQEVGSERKLEALILNLNLKESQEECFEWLYLIMSYKKTYVAFVKAVLTINHNSILYKSWLVSLDHQRSRMTGWNILFEHDINLIYALLEQIYQDPLELSDSFINFLKSRDLTYEKNFNCMAEFIIDKSCHHNEHELLHTILYVLASTRTLLQFYNAWSDIYSTCIKKVCENSSQQLFQTFIQNLSNDMIKSCTPDDWALIQARTESLQDPTLLSLLEAKLIESRPDPRCTTIDCSVPLVITSYQYPPVLFSTPPESSVTDQGIKLSKSNE